MARQGLHIAAFIYARSDSSRLPGKSFLKLGERSLIEVVLARTSLCEFTQVALLTTDRKVDDDLARFVGDMGYTVIRGDHSDLINRTIKALDILQPTAFARINGDSPLVEPHLVNFAISSHNNTKLTSNLINRTFPYGVAVEILDSEYYRSLAGTAHELEKEHVTQHISRQVGTYEYVSIEQKQDHSGVSLAVDNHADLKKMRQYWEELNDDFASYWQILNMPAPELISRKGPEQGEA